MRLWLSLIAYNLGNLWRRLVLPSGTGNLSLTSLQQRLIKTGGFSRRLDGVPPQNSNPNVLMMQAAQNR